MIASVGRLPSFILYKSKILYKSGWRVTQQVYSMGWMNWLDGHQCLPVIVYQAILVSCGSSNRNCTTPFSGWSPLKNKSGLPVTATSHFEDQSLNFMPNLPTIHQCWCPGRGARSPIERATSDHLPPVIQQKWKIHRQLFCLDWGSSVWHTDG